jgi:hypothetical protein
MSLVTASMLLKQKHDTEHNIIPLFASATISYISGKDSAAQRERVGKHHTLNTPCHPIMPERW